MELIDAHCHLQDDRIKAELDSLLQRAKEVGIVKLVCCGSSEEDWEAVLNLKQKYPQILIPSLGLHPWYLKERSENWRAELENLISRTPCGVGEIGLDFALTDFDPEEQKEILLCQLELAQKYQRPASIHCRRAWEALLLLLEKTGSLNAGGIIHSYSGSAELIPQLCRFNLSFSYSCSITRSGNKRARKSILAVPPDKLLLETDSPDIPPPGVSGLNQPANLILVLKTVAALLNKEETQIAGLTTENARRIFGGLN